MPLKKLTDAELLDKFGAGDEAAFRELVTRYKNSLYTFLSNFLNSRELVEDVFQETFIQLFTSRESFDPTGLCVRGCSPSPQIRQKTPCENSIERRPCP